MSSLLQTILMASIIVILALFGLAIGWLITGKNRLKEASADALLKLQKMIAAEPPMNANSAKSRKKMSSPYQNRDGKQVQGIFSKIASRYDLANGVLSFQLHKIWNQN